MHLVITPPVTGAGIARQAVVKSGAQALVSIPGDGYTTNAAHRFNVDDAPQLDL